MKRRLVGDIKTQPQINHYVQKPIWAELNCHRGSEQPTSASTDYVCPEVKIGGRGVTAVSWSLSLSLKEFY